MLTFTRSLYFRPKLDFKKKKNAPKSWFMFCLCHGFQQRTQVDHSYKYVAEGSSYVTTAQLSFMGL